jgi:serine/threonine protein phosphatase PrpC
MNNLFYGASDDTPNPSYAGHSAPATSNPWGGTGSSNAPANSQISSGISYGAEEVGFHISNCSSVKEYGYTEEKNMKFRAQMEDTYCHMDKVAGD